MRNTPLHVSGLVLLVVGGLAGLGCSGMVVAEPPTAGNGSSSGSGSSSGDVGGPGGGVVPGSDGGRGEPGPDGGVPSPPSCSQGGACQAGDGCATAAAGGANACAESCTCDATGHFQCVEECADASTPTGCAQGAACTGNSSCGSASPNGGCSSSCACDATGHLQCTTSCPPAVDAGCVQNVLCIQGDHWDRSQCRCVPDACVSQAGGPCGGFITNPCQCAPGLVCALSGIPDVGGTCQAQSCCPVGWALYSCTDVDGGSGQSCHNPALQCASSSTCGGGCDRQVTGRCPACDPIPCPSGETFDPKACKCIAPSCQSAADCKGVLPALCETCGDGGFGCAHWSCVAGQCQMSFCQ